jgi:hypothetical protein
MKHQIKLLQELADKTKDEMLKKEIIKKIDAIKNNKIVKK